MELTTDNVPLLEQKFDLVKFKSFIDSYVNQHQLDSAVFWYDKIVTLSKGEPKDVYCYADLLYQTNQYHRASNLLQKYKIDKISLNGRYLRALCHFSCKEYQISLDILNQFDADPEDKHDKKDSSINDIDAAFSNSNTTESSISLLKGKIYEALENRPLAIECYKEALFFDVRCYEAFKSLVQHHMLSALEEKQLMDQLPLDKQCPNVNEKNIVKFLYENLLKKYDRPPELVIKSSLLSSNSDVMVTKAERYYYNCDFNSCYVITTQVLKQDPYNSLCLPYHIVVLIELKKTNELFELAHKLVDLYPTNEISWYAVGCYYYLCNKQEPTRRYISKATSLNRFFGPAWLMYGHSFGIENEHDQAIAAYFTASSLMRGCQLPMLYIGMEYGLTNNPKIAEKFFNEALQIAPQDPFVLHEIGVVNFQNNNFELAEKNFLAALNIVNEKGYGEIVSKWEPLFNNLGHVSRNLKKYEASLAYHQQALILIPNNASTYSALGYTHSLMCNYDKAIDCYHQTLGSKKDDSFTTTMLNIIIEQKIANSTLFPEMSDTSTRFDTFNMKLDHDNKMVIKFKEVKEKESVGKLQQEKKNVWFDGISLTESLDLQEGLLVSPESSYRMDEEMESL